VSNAISGEFRPPPRTSPETKVDDPAGSYWIVISLPLNTATFENVLHINSSIAPVMEQSFAFAARDLCPRRVCSSATERSRVATINSVYSISHGAVSKADLNFVASNTDGTIATKSFPITRSESPKFSTHCLKFTIKVF
jgi:hypothetical protein